MELETKAKPPAARAGLEADESTAPLALEAVRFGYERGVEVVCDVSGALAAGRLCCLIGPNAAGKTTLLRLMLGQLEPWSGQVRLMGRPAASLEARQRARWVSYVPQRGGMAFAFTVRQVVEMGRFAQGGDDGAVEAALAACDLLAVQHRPFVHLSGGQQQRVMIARAMAQSRGPGRVMLLDEPGSHLDLWHLHHLMHVLREQAAEGLAVLVVLHDLNLAARYADDVWLMDRGELVAAGRWDAVLRPAVLEPVYGVSLRPLRSDHSDRPVFHIEPSATLLDRLAAHPDRPVP